MAQVVSRRPLTAETRKLFQVSQREICGEGCNSTTGFFFSRSTSVSTNDPYLYSSTYCAYLKDKEAKPGNFPEAIPFRNSGSVGHRGTFSIYSRFSQSC